MIPLDGYDGRPQNEQGSILDNSPFSKHSSKEASLPVSKGRKRKRTASCLLLDRFCDADLELGRFSVLEGPLTKGRTEASATFFFCRP